MKQLKQDELGMETEEEEVVEDVVKEQTDGEFKEYISYESGTIKLSLGSSSRPVEFLCGLLLDMKSKLNNEGEKEKPGFVG